MRLGRRRPAPGSRARAFRAPSRAARAAAPRRRARGTRRALDATRPAPAPPARKRPRRAAKRRRGTRRGAPLWTSSSSRESSARRSWSRRRPRHRSSPPGRVARRSPRGAHQGELSPRTTTQGRQRSTERRATPRLALDCQVQGDGIISVRLPSRLTAIGRVRVLAVVGTPGCGAAPVALASSGCKFLRRSRRFRPARCGNLAAAAAKSRHTVLSIAAVAGAPGRSQRTSSIPRRAAHAWDDASRLQSGSARWHRSSRALIDSAA